MSDKPIHVLLIEDNPGDVGLIREMLSEEKRVSFDVHCVARLSKGLELLAAGEIDVMLLDLSLPDSQGIETLKCIEKEARGTPIIVLTGLHNEATALKSLGMGAQDYLVKGMVDSSVLTRSIFYAIERKQADIALRESEERFRKIFNDAPIGIAIVGLDFKFLKVNQALCKTLGYKVEELIGRPFANITHPEDISKNVKLAHRVFNGEIPNYQLEERYIKKNQEILWINLTLTVIWDDHGKPICGLAMIENITERKQAEKTIVHQAYHDDLTGLPNRALFLDRLSQGLIRALWNKRLFAVLFLDIDNFKRINDTLGHRVGDFLLKMIGERLTACVRGGDTVARLGGDEFAVVLADMARIEDVPEVAQKMIDVVSKPLVLEGHELFITTSIGVSVFPNDARDAENLLKNADTAMYRAKEGGRNNYQHFSPAMNVKALERLSMESFLRHALDREEFLLHYQVLVDIHAGKIIGMEALLRWNHPDLGMVPPSQFIPLAEETGLIVPIGEWVLRKACAQNKAWQSAGFTPMLVSINVSARQVRDRYFSQKVQRTLSETGLEPKHLDLELTETIMQDSETTLKLLCELKAIGIKISIDDFGTGYSSLSYLKRFPIDKLKVDMSFIRNLTTDPNDAAIVEAIITLAHNLKLKAIAEGVETEEQLEILRSLRCDEIQGYLFSRPLLVEEATKLISEGRLLWGQKKEKGSPIITLGQSGQ